jgi:hypothetical protein
MSVYEAPKVTELGSVQDLTLSTITKTAGSGDVIVINGVETTIPGKTVVGVS